MNIYATPPPSPIPISRSLHVSPTDHPYLTRSYLSHVQQKLFCLHSEFHKGPYIKDAGTEGGRGVGPKADIVREVAWIYYYRSSQNADKQGEGSKNPKMLCTSFM